MTKNDMKPLGNLHCPSNLSRLSGRSALFATEDCNTGRQTGVDMAKVAASVFLARRDPFRRFKL